MDSIDAQLSRLMKAAQDGNAAAYVDLLKRIVPVIEGLVRRHLYSDAERVDTVQDILLSVHVVRHTYDPARPFLPWLASIVRNRSVDAIRRQSRIARNEKPMANLPETFRDPQAKDRYEGAGDFELLKCAIAGLPASQREAIEMLKLREMSLKEAAAASGMSIAALKIAAHRAIKTLRIRLVFPPRTDRTSE